MVRLGKYIFQLRRGTRYVDENGATLLNEDGTPVRDDWAAYTAQENHLDPLEGELVVEYEVVNGTGKKTPRLKLGDGVSVFADLDYISVDSFILPTQATITIYPDKWEAVKDENGNVVDNRYIQYVTVNNATITPNSKIDIQPSPSDIAVFYEKDVTFTVINAGGQVRVCVVGRAPTNEYTFNATVTEVIGNA